MIRTRTRMYTVQSCCDAVAIEIPVEIDVVESMMKLAEEAEHSRKYRFAACSTLD